MSNMDYRDPNRDPNPRLGSGDTSSWAWIVGALAIVVVLFLIFGLAGTDQNTAGNNKPMTTGQSSSPAATPPATTGQATPSPSNESR